MAYELSHVMVIHSGITCVYCKLMIMYVCGGIWSTYIIWLSGVFAYQIEHHVYNIAKLDILRKCL